MTIHEDTTQWAAQRLKDLLDKRDAHREETRRLLRDGALPTHTNDWGKRADDYLALTEAAAEAARTLVTVVLP